MNISWFLFSFEGRISRQPFWIFILVTYAVMLIPAYTVFLEAPEKAEYYILIMTFILLWPLLAVQAKRWHDRDKSGWWILINYIPIIGFFWALIENGFLPGTEGENRFGKNPLKNSDDSQIGE